MERVLKIFNSKGKTAVMLCLCIFFGAVGALVEYMGPTLSIEKKQLSPLSDDVRASVTAPSVGASGAILIDGNDGQVIYEKNADERLFPASTTKIMTALVALEIMDSLGLPLTSYVIVPEEAAGLEGSSVYLKKGEKITVEELLYGTMLQSGNDAAAALAICTGGSLGNFVEKMNMRAEELGCANTHFTNANGLSDENHFTTARDLSKIAMEAMKREDFRKIVGAKNWESEESGRRFVNKNKTVFQYDGATGVKIGFTKASGRTLVASASRNGASMIAVVLKDSNWFNDAYSMMDYGFARSE